MRNRIKFIALMALLLAVATPALSDVVPPPKNGKRAGPKNDSLVRMAIQPSPKAKEAELIIPRDVLRQLTAELDGDGSPTVGATNRLASLTGAQTIASGLFLSLALAFGGLWFVRFRNESRKIHRAALGVMALAICGAAAGIAYANAGPPPVARSLTSKVLIPEAMPYGVYGEVRVSITDDGTQIKLVLPRGKDNPK